MWYNAVIDFGIVSSRIMLIKFKFSRVKVCVVVGYGPNEGNGKERERFWNYLDKNVDRGGNGFRLCVLGDLNGWIGGMQRATMKEELWSSLLKEGCMWVINTLDTSVCISAQGWQGTRTE